MAHWGPVPEQELPSEWAGTVAGLDITRFAVVRREEQSRSTAPNDRGGKRGMAIDSPLTHMQALEQFHMEDSVNHLQTFHWNKQLTNNIQQRDIWNAMKCNVY